MVSLTFRRGNYYFWLFAVFLLRWDNEVQAFLAAVACRPTKNYYQEHELLDSTRNNGLTTLHRLHQSYWQEGEENIPFGTSSSSMNHALAIVPPDDAWDSLQRARYCANDRSYTKWPPCIRLFHPCTVTDRTALDVATLIETYEIEPFEIRLNKWSIIPHLEAMEADWEVSKSLPVQKQYDDSPSQKEQKTDIEKLIAQEEERGRQNLKKRLKRQGKDPSTVATKDMQSKTTKLERQRRMYQEFNGPCVVALEPDERSKKLIGELRDLLGKHIFQNDKAYSPTSTVANYEGLPRSSYAADSTGPTIDEYRPLIPIGSFQTVSAAIEMARTLRKSWKELIFNVTDLQLISCERLEADSPSLSAKTSWLSHAQDEEQNLSSDGQFGCDAMIMLFGEEADLDDPTETSLEEMIEILATEGEEGGYGKEATEDDGEREGVSTAIDRWLEEDDDFDEGTVLLMGRTYFFTGEMRLFVGMPATSVMDGKDRLTGDTAISGATRRRGSTHRAGNLWSDGEWGRKDVDLTPWSKADRGRITKLRKENEQSPGAIDETTQ